MSALESAFSAVILTPSRQSLVIDGTAFNGLISFTDVHFSSSTSFKVSVTGILEISVRL